LLGMFGAIRFLSCVGGLNGADQGGTSRRDSGPGGERPCRWSPPSAFRIWMWTRKASSRLEGTRPEGALLEGSRPEEIPAGEGPADLLERFPSRGPVAGVSGGCGTYWRLSRRWRRRRERRFSLPGGGPVATDGPNRCRKSPGPPSPLALIPRLDGDPSPPHDRSSRPRCKGVPRPASFVLSAAVAHLLSHTCGRSAQPRRGSIPAREAHVRGRGNPRLRTTRAVEPPPQTAGRARQARPGAPAPSLRRWP
jgi:hypothetical protein